MQTDFFSLSWFVSVVVVGILINLASAYMKSPIDKLMSRYSARWKAHAIKDKVQRDKEVDLLLYDSNLITLTGITEMRLRLREICYFAIAAFFAWSASAGIVYVTRTQITVAIGFFIIVLGVGLMHSNQANRLSSLLSGVYILERGRAAKAVEKTEALSSSDR